jgi:hypothetical protein
MGLSEGVAVRPCRGARGFQRCNALTETDSEGIVYTVNGISVGWADSTSARLYNWYLADQYIEVSGLPDGYYLLETEADPREHHRGDQRGRQRRVNPDPALR